MVELSLIAPMMLIVSGATIDIGRYLRYQQITSTVSGELANQLYRGCTDATAFLVPQNGSVTIDRGNSQERVQVCAVSARQKAQDTLTNALPGSLVGAIVYRYEIDKIFDPSSQNCGAPTGTVDEVRAPPTNADIQTCSNRLGTISRGVSGGGGNPSNSGPGAAKIAESKIALANGGIKSTAKNVVLVSNQEVCKRNRLVVVEVGYSFTPIVSFLPRFLPGFALDKDGINRETTIL